MAAPSLKYVIEAKYFYDVLTLLYSENRDWVILKVFRYTH